ncbi:mechanosensitive ion channel [PVC group bacterium]|nr:mechanosensitive ion channel [PVC group bacterium]
MGNDFRTRWITAETAIDIAQKRLDRLDKNIDILMNRLDVEKQLGGVRGENENKGFIKKLFGEKNEEQKRIELLIEQARDRRAVQLDRIKHLEAQRTPLKEALALTSQASELYQAEKAFLLEQLSEMEYSFFRQILLPFGIILGFIVSYLVISHLALPPLCKKETLFVYRRLGGYAVTLLIVIVLVVFFLEDLKAIVTVLGLVGAAVIIALQDLCSAFAGWFVITASRKMHIGDRVEIDGLRGEVIDIQILRITLAELNNWLDVDEPTGRTLIIPNSFIFKSHVYNYSHVHPFIWGKADITVTFESPQRESHDLLMKCLVEETEENFAAAKRAGKLMEKHYGTEHAVYEPRIHVLVAESGVCFSLFFVCHYRRFCATKDRILKRVVMEFDKADNINFAYPTERHIPTPPPISSGNAPLTNED